jgi:hypothetical protein
MILEHIKEEINENIANTREVLEGNLMTLKNCSLRNGKKL